MLKNIENLLEKKEMYVIIILAYNKKRKFLRAEQAAATHC